jgi:hypothetical protein
MISISLKILQVNINTNLKAENTYDAIVIGSGIEWLGS